MQTPREHGFWVMLLVTLVAGLLTTPTLPSLGLALLIAGVTIFLAMRLGHRIRKNERLQAGAAASLGLLTVPLTAAGGASMAQIVSLALPLCVVFLATTMTVQAVLLRARRRTEKARFAAIGAFILASTGVVGAALNGSGVIAGAIAPAALLTGVFFFWPPSPKRVKRIGMAVAIVQTMAATLLILP